SYVEVDGQGISVYKHPLHAPGKKSKKGRLKLHPLHEGFRTISSEGLSEPVFRGYEDALQLVFENGKLVSEENFDIIRARTNSYLMP
ncbi:MAG: hypothetical protein MI784_10025, partial [Cytophagales bacterium]|nr:hypothetical protein [Cytophagales bacterium]